jgi:hypothetical protein
MTGVPLTVASVESKERRKNAPPPVHHQQAAAGRLEQAALLAQAHHGPGPAAVRRCRAG